MHWWAVSHRSAELAWGIAPVGDGAGAGAAMAAAVAAGFNLRQLDNAVAASFDETIDDVALAAIITALGGGLSDDHIYSIPSQLVRSSPFLTHHVFHQYNIKKQ